MQMNHITVFSQKYGLMELSPYLIIPDSTTISLNIHLSEGRSYSS